MRHTKKEVIARTRREDALAHIVYWKEHSARVFRGERRLPEMRGLDVPQINRLIYRRWYRRRPAEVVAWHRRVQRDVLEALAANPPEWFSRRERSPKWPLDFDAHSADHRRDDIEAAISPGRRAARAPARRARRPAR